MKFSIYLNRRIFVMNKSTRFPTDSSKAFPTDSSKAVSLLQNFILCAYVVSYMAFVFSLFIPRSHSLGVCGFVRLAFPGIFSFSSVLLETPSQSAFYVNLYRAVIGPSG